ncbi:hypothetical protein LCGC14_0357450 [marine sediment metagenome]|uniref:Helicase ATP-binding domain-containing protein n=1 Tax=marine sediment metagenome TaxID=412755 RepID=A0A0F9VWE3_9ZZZZ
MIPITSASKRALRPLGLRDADMLDISLTDDDRYFILKMWQPNTWRGNGARTYASPQATRDFPLRFPERRRLEGIDQWQVAATDYSAILISQLWPSKQRVAEYDAQAMLTYILLTCKQQEENAKLIARWRDKQEVVDNKYILHPEFPLTKYQRVGLQCAMRSEGYALFMEQGTGKTPIVVARICNESIQHVQMYRAIIVAPKNVRINWQNEFDKFGTHKGRVTVLRGDKLERIKLVLDALDSSNRDRFSVIVCSYEAVSGTWDVLKAINWNLAVLDESHYIKSPRTRRAKYALYLRDKAKARMVLTGTPITNSMLDVYMQLEFLGKGLSGFSTFEAFRKFYGVYRVSESGHKALVDFQNLPFIKERLARISFIIHKKEALPDLPAMVYDVHEVEMTPVQQGYYDDLRKHLAIEIEQDLQGTKNRQLVANNILTKLLRLAQITSGFIKWDGELSEDGEKVLPGEIDRIDPNPKLEGIVELLAPYDKLKNPEGKLPTDKTLIWACWVQDIKSIAARLKLEGIDCVTFYGKTSDNARKEAERRFNEDPKCPVLVANPAAGGTGLNLLGYDHWNNPPIQITNCNHEIYYSQNWSSTARSQSESRPHRRGTRVQIRVTDLCVPETIDEEIRMRVMQKRIAAYEIADVKQILARILSNV